MRTANTYFTNKENFSSFVQKNTFENEENILIQIFSSLLEKEKLTLILHDILHILPQAKVIGATTDGEILNNVVSTNKVIVSMSAFEKSKVHVASVAHTGDSYNCGKALAKKLVKEDTKALFLFADGLNTNGETFLHGVKEYSGKIPIAGGLAGDRAHFVKTYVFSNEGFLASGAVGVAISAKKLHVKSVKSFHWQKVGKELEITRSIENRVYEIDGMTAVKLYEKYLGEEIADLLPAVGIEFPLIITRNGMRIARAVLGKEADGSLIFAGNVHEGDKAHFGYGNSAAILSQAIRTREAIDLASVESIFIYSCMARRRFLHDAISIELTPLASLAPSVGFFTYGEFFKDENDHCELLNQTMTVLAISESATTSTYIFEDHSYRHEIAQSSATHRALSHLIEETSHELEEVNNHLEEQVKEKTKALSQKIGELELASKVKSEFLASMSHEVRTPLNAILGFVDILRVDETDAERQKHFSVIKNSGKTLLRVINDILDFSKIESGKMTLEKRKFITRKPFMEVKELFYEEALESEIEIEFIVREDVPKYFIGDSVRIKQVIANFLSNAIKFSEQGGHILLEVSYDVKNALLHSKVQDNGIGIETQNLEKIFESFTQEDSTTTRKFGGTGLGLSISQELVEGMQGKIEVQSEVGVGSNFSFILPLLEEDILEIAIDKELESIDVNQPLEGKILLVEDNKTNQMLMHVLLEDVNLEVDLAENGLEAVAMFKKSSYDLILMDENMPKMSGIEATTIILQIEKEKNLKHTPIIALTANALSTDKERFLEAGMDKFIPKPIEHKEFIKVLHFYLLKS